jgi:hypothetical protein
MKKDYKARTPGSCEAGKSGVEELRVTEGRGLRAAQPLAADAASLIGKKTYKSNFSCGAAKY